MKANGMCVRRTLPQDAAVCGALRIPRATYVLEKDGAVIGAAAVGAGVCTAVRVAPAWRGRGYGTFFVKRLLRMSAGGDADRADREDTGAETAAAAAPLLQAVRCEARDAALCAVCRKAGLVCAPPDGRKADGPGAADGTSLTDDTGTLLGASLADGAVAAPSVLPPDSARAVPDALSADDVPAPPGAADAQTPFLLFVRPTPAQSAAVLQAHAFLRQYLRPGGTALDATAGNGHDTLFLAHCVGPTGRVTALDIQPQAVRAAQMRLAENGCALWAVCRCDTHANLVRYAQPGTLDAVMFNLGYLPGGDHTVFTQEDTSVPAMRTALTLLRPGGVLTVCLYSGGAQGVRERDAALALFAHLPPDMFTVRLPQLCGFRPVCVCVQKRL